MRTRILTAWTAVAASLAALILVISLRPAGAAQELSSAATEAPPPTEARPDVTSDDTAAGDTAAGQVADEAVDEPDIPRPTTPPTPDQVAFDVDPGLAPVSPSVAPWADGGEPRPTARLRSTGGTESDIVLDELLVAFASDADRDAFLDRWNGTIIDQDEFDEDAGLTDYVVRIDPSTAPVERLAADLLAVEPHHDGTFAASTDDAFALMAIAAHETAMYGTEVALNWLVEPGSIGTGSSREDPSRAENGDPDRADDAFRWSWISSTAPQATGIDAAWQLLRGYGGVGNRVKMMIVDSGFAYNEDFPVKASLRGAEWGAAGWRDAGCNGRKSCLFHGTAVTMAAMARIDNGFGSAGPAAQVADLLAVDLSSQDSAKVYKSLKKIVKEDRPHIINMSFGSDVTAFQNGFERRADRRMRKIRDKYGALAFSSAGNAGVDVDSNDALTQPCELTTVVCVGGLSSDPLRRNSGSNFGTTTGGGSVEIYGPMCVYGLVNPDVPGDSSTTTVCGTSVASPVVAGVAALVKAANPTLGPKEIWQVVKDTAHTDNLGAELGNGHHRRIDAFRAVATAMNRPYTAPEVTILGPTADEKFGPNDFIDLSAQAKNFANLDLAIQWFGSDGNAVNSVPTTDPVVVGELGPGEHVFQARATDAMGNTGAATVTIGIANRLPEVSISSPAANTYRYTVEEVVLDGSTADADELYASLPDEAVEWTVRSLDGGDVVFAYTGHESTIPANTLPAGDYSVDMAGTDASGATVNDSALLTMLDLPPGESLADVTMFSPDVNASYTAGNTTATVHLSATADDAQDGLIPAEQMRWIAEQGDTRIVLCEGSALPGGTDDNCAQLDVELALPPEAPFNNEWTITVEAIDSAGLPGRATRVIEVHASEG